MVKQGSRMTSKLQEKQSADYKRKAKKEEDLQLKRKRNWYVIWKISEVFWWLREESASNIQTWKENLKKAVINSREKSWPKNDWNHNLLLSLSMNNIYTVV